MGRCFHPQVFISIGVNNRLCITVMLTGVTDVNRYGIGCRN
jgi:hypothetical protein